MLKNTVNTTRRESPTQVQGRNPPRQEERCLSSVLQDQTILISSLNAMMGKFTSNLIPTHSFSFFSIYICVWIIGVQVHYNYYDSYGIPLLPT